MEQPHHLLLGLALEVEQILDSVDVEWVPLQFQASWVSIRSLERVVQLAISRFGLLEHGWIQQVVYLLVVDLQKRDVHRDVLAVPQRLHESDQVLNRSLHQAEFVHVDIAYLWQEEALLRSLVLVAIHSEGLA